MASTPTLDDTMTRVKNELKSDGKTKVDIESEAGGSTSLAQRIIESSAAHAGIKVETRVNKKSVSGKVVED